MYHAVRNPGCPCARIGDQALGVSDIQLHFAYGTLTYAATAILVRDRAAGAGSGGRAGRGRTAT